MLRYAGEWYWGIDRLDHLERRLLADGHGRQEDCGPRFVRRHRLCAQPPTPARGPLVLYWSARSPYSYLVLDRAYALADHYGLGLDIRPVLPMVMRGMSVPRQKRLYILQDAKREAELLGLPLGRVCDPVGRGVRNLYAVFRAGQAEGRERELARSFSHAVWSEGIDAATERGLARITERAGLRPQRLRREPEAEWHEWAERHRQEMADAGMWGVPTLRYGSHWVWGQDRLWSLETAIRNHG
jgi:2-hydroxychromene-2-carboxylate isomerase